MYLLKNYTSILFCVFVFPLFILNFGCKGQDANAGAENTKTDYKYYADWFINTEYMQTGCPGAECIKSIDKPVFINPDEVDFMQDDDLVLGIKINNEIRAYPYAILNWHEIVNDKIGDKKISIVYCPLTGSGMAWNRVINGKETEFGVSGLLFNSNLIPYDRNTGSFWSQMKQQCVNGEFYKMKADVYQTVETDWKTWKLTYPDSKILSTQTGYNRNYGEYPYENYRETDDVYFPVEYDNDSIFQKERIFGIINGDKAKCYRFDKFKNGTQIIYDVAFDKNIILIGNADKNFIVAFENNFNSGNLLLKPVTDKSSGIAEDASGNVFDLFGYCIEGPQKGERLTPVNGFIAYWFGWAAFYPGVEVVK